MVYIILNSDGRIHTVGEKDDNVLSEGQTKETSELSLVDFVAALPDVPCNCVKVGEIYVSQPLQPVIIYNPNALISWAMAQLFTQALIPHFAAFLDFANKASQTATDNFRAYATAVSQSALAETIIAKAIELGAKIV